MSSNTRTSTTRSTQTNPRNSETSGSSNTQRSQDQGLQNGCFDRIKREFNCSMLNLEENNPSKFATTAWVRSQVPYLVFRIVCFVHAFTILIWKSIDENVNSNNEIDWILLLPTWNFILYTAYHLLALLLTSFEFFTDCLCNDDLLWYHKVNWLLQTVTFNVSVACFFGTVIHSLAKINNDTATLTYTELFTSDDVNFYAIPGTVMIIDVLVSNVTVRLLHALYSSAFYFIYFVFHLYRWGGGYTPQVYILDYGNYAGEAVLCIFIVVFIIAPVVHFLAYGIDTLRCKLLLACIARHKRRMIEVINARNGLITCSGSSYYELRNQKTTVSFNLNTEHSEFRSTLDI